MVDEPQRMPGELLAVLARLPVADAVRVASELGTMQGESVRLGEPLEALSGRVAARAEDGPDREVWGALADVFAGWAGDV